MIVDYQAHLHPRVYLESLVGRSGYPRAERRNDGYFVEMAPGDCWNFPAKHVDLEIQLADMDAHGVDVMVSCPSIVGEVSGLDREHAHEAAEMLNEGTARAQRENPSRFVGLAVFPQDRPELALKVIERAITKLELRGVCAFANTNGRALVGPDSLPIYRKIAELGIPLFLHPASRSVAFGKGFTGIVEWGLNWMYDTSAAALSLITSGTLDACPNLMVVHPHLGGTIPYVRERLVKMENMMSQRDQAHPIGSYLADRFYTDTTSDSASAMKLALETYGRRRILFATDYPWKDRAAMFKAMNEMTDKSLAQAILHENVVEGLKLPRSKSAG